MGKDFSLQKNFSFLKSLLKNVKSKVFADIQTENCIVFNTEVGCFACRARIKKCEEDRFDTIKKLDDFYSVLRSVFSFEQFLEDQVYEKIEFLRIYEQIFQKKKFEREKNDEFEETEGMVNEKLIQNNVEILKVIELNELRLNVMKDVPCHEFFDYSDAYKLKGFIIEFID